MGRIHRYWPKVRRPTYLINGKGWPSRQGEPSQQRWKSGAVVGVVFVDVPDSSSPGGGEMLPLM